MYHVSLLLGLGNSVLEQKHYSFLNVLPMSSNYHKPSVL